jgi:hypothetical protein
MLPEIIEEEIPAELVDVKYKDGLIAVKTKPRFNLSTKVQN